MTSSAPLYDYSVVPMTSICKNILACMAKAEAYATEKGENVDDYLKLRIIADMHPFTFQIQAMSNQAKYVLSRVAGADATALAMEDNETTWAQCKERLERTIKVLDGAKPDAFVGKETTEISLFGGKFNFTGLSYVQSFALPNFYFHATTAYDLLRGKGVELGKRDFIAGGGPPPGLTMG